MQFRAVSGAQNLGFVPGISGMPETLPETSMPETLPTLQAIQYTLYENSSVVHTRTNVVRINRVVRTVVVS